MGTVNVRNALGGVMANADDMAVHATKVSNFMRKVPKIAGLVIGGTALLDWGMDTSEENKAKREAERMKKEEERQNERTDEAKAIAYADMRRFENYVQNLWDERSKHSNRWGGRLY